MCISSTIQDKIDPASWYMRKQGWAGATNPANILETRGEKLLGLGSGKTETEKRAARMGQKSTAAHQAAGRYAGTPVHSKLIEGIASRR